MHQRTFCFGMGLSLVCLFAPIDGEWADSLQRFGFYTLGLTMGYWWAKGRIIWKI